MMILVRSQRIRLAETCIKVGISDYKRTSKGSRRRWIDKRMYLMIYKAK